MDWRRTSLAAALAVSVAGLAWSGTAQAEDEVADAVLGGLGSGQRAGRARKDFTSQDRHRDEIRVRALDELRRPLPQRTQLAEQALRPHHRRQPVDRRRRRERPLRQAQRFLRQRTTSRWTTSCRRRCVGYSEWPKNTPNYWALPAMGDAVGWTYRKDWFAQPELQAEFKKKYGRDLAPPKTWDELKQIAEFFQGREIDGKKVYGSLHLHRARLRRHHDGRDQRALRLRLPVRRPEEALPHGQASSTRRTRSRGSSSTRRSTSAARRRA